MDASTTAGSPTGATPPPGPPAGRPGPRRLRRRPDDGHVAGVCAGVAEYFNVDPVIVRIAAVVLLFSGPGAFAYVLAWIFVPAAPGPVPYGTPQAPIDRKDRGTQIFGIVLLALAISLIWGDWWSPARQWLFPLGLMGIGAWLLLRRDKDDDAPPSSPAAPPPASAPPAGTWAGGAASTEVTSTPVHPEPGDDTTALLDPAADDGPETASGEGGDGSDDAPPTAPWDVPPPPVTPEPPPASTRHRRMLGPITFGALLIWSGLAFLTDVSLKTGLAGALVILGIGFCLGTFVGGSRALILPAIVVGAALVVTAAVDIPLSGPIGDQTWRPWSLAEVADDYEVSVGEGTLDLTAIDIPRGDRLDIEASVGVGHLIVLIPTGMTAEITSDVGAGEAMVFDQQHDGVGVTTDRRLEGTADSGTLHLDLQVGMGKIEVHEVTDTTPATTTSTTSTTVLG